MDIVWTILGLLGVLGTIGILSGGGALLFYIKNPEEGKTLFGLALAIGLIWSIYTGKLFK